MNEKTFKLMLARYSDKNFFINELRTLVLIGSLPLIGMVILIIISYLASMNETTYLTCLTIYLFLSITLSMAIIIMRIVTTIQFIIEYKKRN